ncbi:MAG TPA: DinB family protein [Vicinamibacterales bacterium]|nr:DinB family protein [Vicinamibacterales bacterium]
MTWNHSQRLIAASRAFDAATAAFLSFLEQLPEAETREALPGGWSPSSHAEHLALTNDVFLSVLKSAQGCTGPIPPFAGASDYAEDTWNMDAPPPATAPPILVPPPFITRAVSVTNLRASRERLAPAIAAADEAIAAQCVRLPWATISVYQMCEWASGHTLRHLWQVNRELQLRTMGIARAGVGG